LAARGEDERSFVESGSWMQRQTSAARKLFARAVGRQHQEMDPAP
jgi:hypothetical protein